MAVTATRHGISQCRGNGDPSLSGRRGASVLTNTGVLTMNSRIVPCAVLTMLWLLAGDLSASLGDDVQKNGGTDQVLPARQAGQAVERALTFLVNDALKWREERTCVTCHHGIMTVWALSEAKNQGYKVNAEALADMVQWTRDRFAPRSDGSQAPHPGLASIPQLYLGIMAQNLPVLSRDEINRIALTLAARQQGDGTWNSPPPKNGPPPTWESRETIALLSLLAWEPYVPANAREAAPGAGRDKTLAWLSETRPTETTQAITLRLLLDVRRGTPEKQLQIGIDRLLARQNSDSGWRQTNEMPSDAYATGQALYALSFTGVKSDREVIRRVVSFLVATQRDDGAWPMASRGHPGEEPYVYLVPITYFGSAWATLGLARSVPSVQETLPK